MKAPDEWKGGRVEELKGSEERIIRLIAVNPLTLELFNPNSSCQWRIEALQLDFRIRYEQEPS
jgi:hypothetical protein